MKLLIGTSNKGKIIEVGESLSALPVELISPLDLGITEKPHEEGTTFEANAIQKARYYHDLSHLSTLADDSGIIVEALENELGIHTRRWGAGPTASDQEWIDYFLSRMKKESNKRAHFICVLCYIDHDGMEHLFQGTCDGAITESLEAEYLPGLPISACFKPDGFDVVYSAMSVEDKNRISHRGKALKECADYLVSATGR